MANRLLAYFSTSEVDPHSSPVLVRKVPTKHANRLLRREKKLMVTDGEVGGMVMGTEEGTCDERLGIRN